MADDDDLPGLDDLITDKGELEVDTSGLPDMPDLGLVESKLVKSFKAAAEKSKINFEGADAIYADLKNFEKGKFNDYKFTIGKKAKGFAKELEQQLQENDVKNVKVVVDPKKGEVKLLYLRVTMAKEPGNTQTEKPYGEHGSIERAVYDAAKASSLPFYDKDGRTPDRTSMGNTIKSVRDFFAKVRGNPDNYVYLNLPVGDKNFAKNLEKQLRPIFAKENQQLKLDGVALVMGQKPPRVSNVSY